MFDYENVKSSELSKFVFVCIIMNKVLYVKDTEYAMLRRITAVIFRAT